MISMIMFTDTKKMKKENRLACISIIHIIKGTETVSESIIEVLCRSFGMED